MRKIAFLLALLMVLGSCLVACGEENKVDFVLHVGDYKSISGTSVKSSNTDVVEVVRDGLICACAPGTAKISFKEGDKIKTYTVKVLDPSTVTLGTGYESVSMKEVQKTIDSSISDLISQYAAYTEVTDRKDVREGDKVNIDYVGKMDGVAFEGGTGTYDLVIGSNSFIDGFEDGLIGKENGTTVDLNLTFPESYPNNPDLAGKPVVFTVTINKISAPEAYDDAFVKKNTGYETVKEYEEHMKMLAVTDAMFLKLASVSTVPEMDQGIKDQYYDEYVQQMIDYLKSYGMTVTTKEEVIATMGYTEANFDEMVWSQVTEKIKQDYVFYSYCHANNLKLTDELYQKYLADFLKLYGCSTEADMLKKYSITLDTLYETFLYEMVMEHLYAKAVYAD